MTGTIFMVDESWEDQITGLEHLGYCGRRHGVSLFSANDTPAVVTVNDPHPVELGLKFQSSQTGRVTTISFYKGSQNTGTHVGNLWSGSGTLLATATFNNETSSGWQQVNLSSSVWITAGTIYVVSYHTNGDYSGDHAYFDGASQTNGPLPLRTQLPPVATVSMPTAAPASFLLTLSWGAIIG